MSSFDDMVECVSNFEETNMTEVKKNFRHSYSNFETLEEARKDAQRATARSFSSEDIWQRIEETVVPDVDIQINPIDVKTSAIKS